MPNIAHHRLMQKCITRLTSFCIDLGINLLLFFCIILIVEFIRIYFLDIGASCPCYFYFYYSSPSAVKVEKHYFNTLHCENIDQ